MNEWARAKENVIETASSVEHPKYRAMESYFNAWNDVNSMWPLHSILDTKFGDAMKVLHLHNVSPL